MAQSIENDLRCPCGTGDTYAECCGRFHAGPAAPTAEALMRSRYCAYALLGRDPQRFGAYLHATWDPATRPALAEPGPEWMRLQILGASGGPFDDAATVEFVALYRDDDGARHRMHELSRFRRESGRWLYIDGDVR
ncbi:YchJ family protein [Zhihengliuella salsuginis]|uniref:UPF0225 protein n=1 Tax=Zhihengliuella salsuginis TaxID=578222 RepID=A0ABQ3GBF5_9MICC|nr:YchJ family metal-binding protein [Zhihengliuella salsuginis]GHC99827.1 UPF0225 protein [Zhihengliuella salsuginis]